MRPLPRSLDPLPDETLTGSVLRLAHRLGTTPAEIAHRTGLARGSRPGLPPTFQYHLDDTRLTDFARATNLTTGEVADLLLAPLGQRYGPLNPAFTPRSTPARVIYDNPWVLTRWTRYCPPCLVGNGTPIQDRHGGPWQRLWRLPVTFLCFRHRRLLTQRCRSCGTLPQSTQAGSAINRLTDGALNPWQCRSAKPLPESSQQTPGACGAALTQKGVTDEQPDAATVHALVRVQRHLERLLAADGTDTTMSAGSPVPVAHSFADLRAAVAIIFRTWPEACPYVSTSTLATALDAEHDSRAALAQPLLNTAGKKKTSKPYTTPPHDSLAAGAVLDIGSQLLAAANPYEARVRMAPLVQRLQDADRALSTYLRRPEWISVPLRAAVTDGGWHVEGSYPQSTTG